MESFSLNTAPSEQVLVDDIARGCRITYLPGYMNTAASDALFEQLRRETPFEREAPVMFGRPVEVRRRTCSFGSPGIKYRYSGIVRPAAPWPTSLASLADQLSSLVGAPFNYVLCQIYPDGAAGIGWHADDERDLVSASPIASLSLGAERNFQVRLGNRGPMTLSVRLGHGSLLVMHGATQQHYQHQVPKSARCNAPRINLTFRVIRGA